MKSFNKCDFVTDKSKDILYIVTEVNDDGTYTVHYVAEKRHNNTVKIGYNCDKSWAYYNVSANELKLAKLKEWNPR